MPFWRGDGPGRPIEVGQAIGAFLRDMGSRDDARAVLETQYGLDPLAAGNLERYIEEQKAATGTLPTDRAITIERFRDEIGDWRVCILSSFGSRVHAPWALALEARLAAQVGFEVQALWTDEVAAYDGEFVSFPPTWSWPKPEVRVPVLIGGGAGPKMFAHLAEYADGWIPIGGAGLSESIPRYKEAVAAAGRDPEAMRIIPFGSLPTAPKLEHFASIGVTECVFRLPSAPTAEVLTVLDEQAELLGELRG